jgi:UDP-N-acetylmuramate dehydrogenase
MHDPEGLVAGIKYLRARGWSLTWLGAGTRTVVRDGGLGGAVVRLGTGFSWVRRDGDWLDIGAATPMPVLGSSIPGSVGASVALDKWKGAAEVRTLRGGRLHTGPPESVGKQLILSVRVREDCIPTAVGGAWFSSPSAVRTALERVDLAGARLRGVAVSRVAPELLVNLGGGTARDLTLLNRSIRDRVKRYRGVELDLHVKFIGTATRRA